MKKTIKQIIFTEVSLFIIFQILLYLVKGNGYIIYATFPIVIFLMFFTFFYLSILITSSVMFFNVKQEFLKNPGSVYEFLLKYRLLIFFHFIFYGYLLMFSYYSFHSVYFHDIRNVVRALLSLIL